MYVCDFAPFSLLWRITPLRATVKQLFKESNLHRGDKIKLPGDRNCQTSRQILRNILPFRWQRVHISIFMSANGTPCCSFFFPSKPKRYFIIIIIIKVLRLDFILKMCILYSIPVHADEFLCTAMLPSVDSRRYCSDLNGSFYDTVHVLFCFCVWGW